MVHPELGGGSAWVRSFTLRATLGVPAFNRHGEESETPALTEGTTVEFTDVELSTE